MSYQSNGLQKNNTICYNSQEIARVTNVCILKKYSHRTEYKKGTYDFISNSNFFQPSFTQNQVRLQKFKIHIYQTKE